MEKSLLENLFDPKLIKLIRFFLDNKEQDFYLQEIVKATKLPLATTYRQVKKLASLDIVEKHMIKHFTLYRCAATKEVLFLESFIKESPRLVERFVNEAITDPQVEEIILHGKQTEERANLLLIGKDINHQHIKELCSSFKERGYTISVLQLEREQYEQMSAMGLYSGRKEQLFKR